MRNHVSALYVNNYVFITAEHTFPNLTVPSNISTNKFLKYYFIFVLYLVNHNIIRKEVNQEYLLYIIIYPSLRSNSTSVTMRFFDPSSFKDNVFIRWFLFYSDAIHIFNWCICRMVNLRRKKHLKNRRVQ